MLACVRNCALFALGIVSIGCTLTTPLDELRGSGGGGTGAAGASSSASSGSSASSASSTATTASVTSSSTGSGDPCATPLFFDDFGSGLADWQADSGNWTIENGALVQQDEQSGQPTIRVPAFPTLADQRLRATTKAVSGPTNGAIQLVARIDPSNPGNRYWCAFQPWDGWFIIRVEANYLTVNDPVAFQVNLSLTPGYSPTASRVMHFDVVGTMLKCWVEGVVGADATTSDGLYTQGAFGLKTYYQRVSFDDVTVCP